MHPFEDGNGRLSRILLNAELYRAGLWPILIPTAFREDYLGGLRCLSRQKDPSIYLKVLEKAQSLGPQIDFTTFNSAASRLKELNAFEEGPENTLNWKLV